MLLEIQGSYQIAVKKIILFLGMFCESDPLAVLTRIGKQLSKYSVGKCSLNAISNLLKWDPVFANVYNCCCCTSPVAN